MKTQTISIPVDKGTADGYLAAPDAGGPAVLVLHAWWGLIPFFKQLCDRLAQAGYVAFAPDLYAGRTATTVEGAEALLQQRDFEYMQNVAVGATQLLRHHPLNTHGRIAAMGFSMGAAWTVALASQAVPEDIRAGVLFYGIGEGDFERATASFQGHFAPGDEWEPDEGVQQTEDALRKAGRDVTFYKYEGTKHWFMEDQKPDTYDAAAAQLAWERTLAFLKAQFAKA